MLRLHGNPADYAWGAEGLDSIITQVREQWKEKVILSVNTLSLVWPQITRMVVKGSIATRKKAKQKWNENLSKLKKTMGWFMIPNEKNYARDMSIKKKRKENYLFSFVKLKTSCQ